MLGQPWRPRSQACNKPAMTLRSTRPPATADTTSRPERWWLDAGDAAEAVLTIPADPQRTRRFEIACAMTVRCGDPLHGAWHEMTVLANGAQQWRRRITSSNPGTFDGLDYRFARTLAPGEPLRLVLRLAVRGVQRHRLVVEADEG